jgi:hypothetical protein
MHPARPRGARRLTAKQIAAVQVVMQLFADEDRENGVSARFRIHCHACRRPRPAPGFVPYGDLKFCNACATQYEISRMRRLVITAEEFVRWKALVAERTTPGRVRQPV